MSEAILGAFIGGVATLIAAIITVVMTRENNSKATILNQAQQFGPIKEPLYSEEKIDGVVKDLRSIHTQYYELLPVAVLLPRLRSLFNRNTFREKIEDCVAEDWVTRVRAVLLTLRVLRAYTPSVSAFGDFRQQQLYSNLLSELQSYAQNLTGLFTIPFNLPDVEKHLNNAKQLKDHLPKPMPRTSLSSDAIGRCNTNLKKISSLWEELGQLPTLE